MRKISVPLDQTSGARLPIGLSFDVRDLLLAQAWAEFHELRLEVDLDCAVADEVYEEMIGLFTRRTGIRRWTVWRSCNGIVVQPIVGRPRLFDSLAEALGGLLPP